MSNELVSMTLAMVSESREVNTILKELFTPEGNELYVHPASRYLRSDTNPPGRHQPQAATQLRDRIPAVGGTCTALILQGDGCRQNWSLLGWEEVRTACIETCERPPAMSPQHSASASFSAWIRHRAATPVCGAG